jgi:tetratricopeptide (TPR) repeat protein
MFHPWDEWDVRRSDGDKIDENVRTARAPMKRNQFRASHFLCLLLLIFSCAKGRGAAPVKVGELVRHQNLGLADLEENRLQEAKSEYEKVIQLAPQESLGYANLAICLLRLGDYDGANQKAQQALQKSDAPDVRLIVAEINDRSGKLDAAINETENALLKSPRHVRLNFKAAQLSISKGDWERAAAHLKRVMDVDPGNLATQLFLIESLVRTNQPEAAANQLRETRKQILDLSAEMNQYFQTAINLLQEHKSEAGLLAVISIHNLLKPSPLYQRSITELVGPGGAMIGFPIEHFSAQVLQEWKTEKTSAVHFHYVDATSDAGLSNLHSTSIAVGDFNGDGKPDLFISGESRLLKNEGHKFTDVTSSMGITVCKGSQAKFADFDNDGKLDLYVACEDRHILYRNDGAKFIDVTTRSGINEKSDASPLFLDLDNEGDLDLLLLRPSGNTAYRNNGDGTFTLFGADLGLQKTGATSAVFADFDEDGDLDLFLSGGSTSALFDDERSGHFLEKPNSGLPATGIGAAAAADVNNDGYVDLLLNGVMYINKQNGTFVATRPSNAPRNDSQAFFADIDNDGWKDLLLLSTNRLEVRRNAGNSTFVDASKMVPPIGGRYFAVADCDSDGDEDVIVTDHGGTVHLLRNDGGNTNYWVNVRPVGLGPDSGKNNRNSIGAKVEVKAGTLYQMSVVSDPVVHFGLGDHTQSDVVRVTWTNGTSQNHVLPGSNQTIVEKQVLKGSCAFLYAWNGSKFEFVTDILWKSALGMPLGIMAGEMHYGFPDSTQEYLKVPGQALHMQNRAYSIRVTEELWEVAYLDQMRLIVLDHPENTSLYVNEAFVIPPYPSLHIYGVREKRLPVRANDDQGHNLLPLLRTKDDQYVANFSPGDYQGIAAMHDLILDLGKLPQSADVVLFLNGWLFPTDASINVAIAQSNRTQIVRPYLQVPDANGNWQTVMSDIGFPQGKNKTMVLDLKGRFFSDDHRIRIRTNMDIFWDQVFYTTNEAAPVYQMTSLAPSTAEIHDRGFSRLYRKAVNGPYWFDYSNVSREQRWRDLVGDYTRYGDVTRLLQASDDRYVIINSGDEVSIRFDASNAPGLKKGWKRDFLLYSDGWMKDGDMSTADGKTVGPLPFHSMSQYPYDERKESYPHDALHQEYLHIYNTRKVTAEKFRKLQ